MSTAEIETLEVEAKRAEVQKMMRRNAKFAKRAAAQAAQAAGGELSVGSVGSRLSLSSADIELREVEAKRMEEATPHPKEPPIYDVPDTKHPQAASSWEDASSCGPTHPSLDCGGERRTPRQQRPAATSTPLASCVESNRRNAPPGLPRPAQVPALQLRQASSFRGRRGPETPRHLKAESLVALEPESQEDGSDAAKSRQEEEPADEDIVAYAENLLERRHPGWVTDNVIFEDDADELSYHDRRSQAFGHVLRAFTELRAQNELIREKGASLLEDLDRLQEDHRHALGDLAYWRELAKRAADEEQASVEP